MKHDGVPPDIHTYTSLINACCKAGDMLEAEACIEFSMLLGLEGRSGDYIGKESQSSKAHIRLREPSKSEDKVEYANVAPKEAKKNKIGVLKQVVKRSMAMPWYRRGGTFMESSIPSLMEGERLVMKRIEEMENTKANSKYRDKVKG
ncbi:hypothetical protein GW17_00008068 [Ensete ventricosum]|nr:hypothetical protein GW17_00008068 [Ensete ventricosum]